MFTPDFPRFVSRAPWLGPDLQTVRNFLRRPASRFEEVTQERLALPLRDGSGDRLSVLLQRPLEGAKRALAVLVHGLGGSEESTYMSVSAEHLLSRGHPVLRVNLRGAGPSREFCRLQYHAGRTEDLRDLLDALPAGLRGAGVILLGYSLGGNAVLKLLGEEGQDPGLLAAATVSAPIDLASASHRFQDARNRVYQWHLLRWLQQEALGARGGIGEAERRGVLSCRSVYEFDHRFVAPRNGWQSADAYYAACMSRQFLPAIRVPTLLIHALDDPWIPGKPYTSFDWQANPHLMPLLPRRGGHVGFHGRGDRLPWHDRCVSHFLDALGL